MRTDVELSRWFVTHVPRAPPPSPSGSSAPPSRRGPLRVWGYAPDGQLWRSSSVCDAPGPRTLVTRYGTTVRLRGPLDRAAARAVALAPALIALFADGLPPAWRAAVDTHRRPRPAAPAPAPDPLMRSRSSKKRRPQARQDAPQLKPRKRRRAANGRELARASEDLPDLHHAEDAALERSTGRRAQKTGKQKVAKRVRVAHPPVLADKVNVQNQSLDAVDIAARAPDEEQANAVQPSRTGDGKRDADADARVTKSRNVNRGRHANGRDTTPIPATALNDDVLTTVVDGRNVPKEAVSQGGLKKQTRRDQEALSQAGERPPSKIPIETETGVLRRSTRSRSGPSDPCARFPDQKGLLSNPSTRGANAASINPTLVTKSAGTPCTLSVDPSGTERLPLGDVANRNQLRMTKSGKEVLPVAQTPANIGLSEELVNTRQTRSRATSRTRVGKSRSSLPTPPGRAEGYIEDTGRLSVLGDNLPGSVGAVSATVLPDSELTSQLDHIELSKASDDGCPPPLAVGPTVRPRSKRGRRGTVGRGRAPLKEISVAFASNVDVISSGKKQVSKCHSLDADDESEAGFPGTPMLSETWSREQLDAFDKQRTAIPGKSLHYWTRIADGVPGKSADDCMSLWNSTWSSPCVKERRISKTTKDLPGQPPKFSIETGRAEASTPEVAAKMASAPAAAKRTAKFKKNMRRVAEAISREQDDDELEPPLASLTPTVEGVLNPLPDSLLSDMELRRGTPDTAAKSRRAASERLGATETPEVLARGRSFGLQEADTYLAVFNRRRATGSKVAVSSSNPEKSTNVPKTVSDLASESSLPPSQALTQPIDDLFAPEAEALANAADDLSESDAEFFF